MDPPVKKCRLTPISLQVDGNDSTTKSMLLVSDDVDDGNKVDGITDDDKNDRTHKIQLGGKFKITNVKADGTDHFFGFKTPVPVQKTVTFDVVILRQTAGGAAVVAQPDVESDLKRALERYAQVGIKLKWSINTVDPPQGVDLSDGLSEYSQVGSPTAEEQALFNGIATASPDDIQVFYVNFFKKPAQPADPGSKGESFWLAAFTAPVADNIVISASQKGPFTLPHELGHVLKNDGSHYSDSTNLMRNGTSSTDALEASKRLTTSQEQSFQSSSHAK